MVPVDRAEPGGVRGAGGQQQPGEHGVESRIRRPRGDHFTGWLTDMILRGVFEPLDEYAE